jgi:hypothetical protein
MIMSFLTILFACCRDVSPTILDFSGAGTYGRKSIWDIIQFGPNYTRVSLGFVKLLPNEIRHLCQYDFKTK